jgi:hypothetical protein
VIEHLIGTGRADHIDLGGRRGARHVRAGRLGELHGEHPDSA